MVLFFKFLSRISSRPRVLPTIIVTISSVASSADHQHKMDLSKDSLPGINVVNISVRNTSNKNEAKYIFYDYVKNTLRMCQFFGVGPVYFKSDTDNSANKENINRNEYSNNTVIHTVCKFSFTSLSAISSYIWLSTFLLLTPKVLLETYEKASGKFSKTDYFFHSKSLLFRTTITIIVLAVNILRGPSFCKVWNKLSELIDNELHYCQLQQYKNSLQILQKQQQHPTHKQKLFYQIGQFTFFIFSFEFFVHLIILASLYFKRSQLGVHVVIPVLFPFHQFFSTFLLDIYVGLFCLLCFYIIQSFQCINELVKGVMLEIMQATATGAGHKIQIVQGQGSNNLDSQQCRQHHNRGIIPGENDLANRISELRNLHESFCEVVRCLEKAFGIQLLAIISSTTVDYIGGVYCIIGSLDGYFSEENRTAIFLNGIVLVFYGVRILLILFFSQNITNAGKSPAHILNTIQTRHCNPSILYELELFLTKLANFPIELSCCNILKLSGGFLASAASNIVTYVLVLMQFKLNTIEPDCSMNFTTTLVNNSSDAINLSHYNN